MAPKKGSPVNWHVLEAIAGHTDLKVDFTGGVSTYGEIAKAFEYGAAYITAASVAVTDPELFASWIISYGREKITLGADVINRDTKELLFRGWQYKSQSSSDQHFENFDFTAAEVRQVHRRIARRRAGRPCLWIHEDILHKFPDACVLASGGVRGVDDIKRLNDMGILRRDLRQGLL